MDSLSSSQRMLRRPVCSLMSAGCCLNAVSCTVGQSPHAPLYLDESWSELTFDKPMKTS